MFQTGIAASLTVYVSCQFLELDQFHCKYANVSKPTIQIRLKNTTRSRKEFYTNNNTWNSVDEEERNNSNVIDALWQNAAKQNLPH